MDVKGTDTQGTGLIDVYRILFELPRERLLSMTFQLGESPEEDIVQAMCLIFLQRGPQGLYRLQTRKDNNIANHMAETWKISGGMLENFKVKCGHFQAVAAESWVGLARIFKVLSKQKLCDPLLRDLAYQRALSAVSQDPSDFKHMEYSNIDIDSLKEEAKLVCGPQLAEWLCSGCFNDPKGEINTALTLSMSQVESESKLNLPSPLQEELSTVSYPTHLEISSPPTATVEGDITTVKSDHRQPSMTFSLVSEDEVKEGLTEALPEPVESRRFTANGDPKTDKRGFATIAERSCNLGGHIAPTQSPKNITIHTDLPKPTPPPSPCPTKIDVPKETREEESEDEEEKPIFYSFVILHAPEDEVMADGIKVKVESIGIVPGAIFSEDFAIPGKSTLRCIEDAINHSAFTILLLTKNFNTRRLEVETESALVNSIYKKHKYNSVIPLLPRKNCLPLERMPIVLKTLVTLEENSSFERRIKKTISKAQIASQKRIWAEEQRVKEQVRRMERLEQSNMNHEQYIREAKRADQVELERLKLLEQEVQMRRLRLSGLAIQQSKPHEPHIHIENANYIMIGSNSNMTVGGGTSNDDAGDDED